MKLFSRATHASLRRMRTRTNLIALAVASFGVAAVFACGSTPKSEPGAATAMPSATAPSVPASASAMPASTADAASPTTAADAGGGDKAAQCDALVAEANTELDAERIKVDKACKKDADCMPIKGRACGFVCTTGAIPKAEEKEWTAELTRMKDGPCKKWEEMECSKVSPPRKPTCANDSKKPACEKGLCILK